MSGCHEPNDKVKVDFVTPATISVAEWEHMQRKFTDLVNVVADLSLKLNTETTKRIQIFGETMTLHNRIVAIEKVNEHQAQQIEDFEARLDELEEGDF